MRHPVWEEITEVRRLRRDREQWRADQVTDWRAELARYREGLDRSLTPGEHYGDAADPRYWLIELAAAAVAWAAAMEDVVPPAVPFGGRR